MNKELETTTIWKFKDRGNWATHKGDYRGNWSPYVPRNLILKYTNKSDYVLDMFLGSGTTLIECKLLNRNGIGIDVNNDALVISNDRLNFDIDNESKQEIFLGDARNMNMIGDNSIDLICSHPPYSNIIKYSLDLDNDLSHLEYNLFLDNMKIVANECYRVLKPNKFCAIMIGDIRKNKLVIPLGFDLMQLFCSTGFKLAEIIIKEQNNCSSTKYWKSKKNLSFYLLAHEYIFVFKKI